MEHILFDHPRRVLFWSRGSGLFRHTDNWERAFPFLPGQEATWNVAEKHSRMDKARKGDTGDQKKKKKKKCVHEDIH